MCLDFLDCFAESFERKKHVKLHLQTGNAAVVMVQKCLVFGVEGVLWVLCSVEKI